MNRLIATLISLVVVSGCATDPIPTAQTSLVPSQRIYDASYLEQTSERGLIIIKRDRPRVGVNCDNVVYVDGTKIATIEPTERLELYLSPNEHIVGVNKPTCWGEMRELAVTPVIGGSKILRIWSDQDGHLQLQPTAF